MKRHKQFIPIRPLAKERPRATRSGHVYTPKRTSQYEKKVGEAYTGPLIPADHTVEVSLTFSKEGTHIVVIGKKNPEWKSSLRGDIDNYVKSILDALNGIAWEDDVQIVEVTVKKL